jgi:hypothetical protein
MSEKLRVQFLHPGRIETGEAIFPFPHGVSPRSIYQKIRAGSERDIAVLEAHFDERRSRKDRPTMSAYLDQQAGLMREIKEELGKDTNITSRMLYLGDDLDKGAVYGLLTKWRQVVEPAPDIEIPTDCIGHAVDLTPLDVQARIGGLGILTLGREQPVCARIEGYDVYASEQGPEAFRIEVTSGSENR